MAAAFERRYSEWLWYIHMPVPKWKWPDLQRCDQFQALVKSMGTDECSVLLKTRPFIYRCLNMAPNFAMPGFKIIYHLPPLDIWVSATGKGEKGNGETAVTRRRLARAPRNVSVQ